MSIRNPQTTHEVAVRANLDSLRRRWREMNSEHMALGRPLGYSQQSKQAMLHEIGMVEELFILRHQSLSHGPEAEQLMRKQEEARLAA